MRNCWLLTQGAASTEEGIPAQVTTLRTWLFGKANSHVRHVLHSPIKVKRRERINIHIGSRVHEVDSIRDAVANSPLDRVHVIAQGTHKFERILHNAHAHFGTKELVFNIIFALIWVILDRHDYFLPQAYEAHILLPFDEFLHNDRTQAELVVVIN